MSIPLASTSPSEWWYLTRGCGGGFAATSDRGTGARDHRPEPLAQ